MTIVLQTVAAAVLVTLTLFLQSAGMAALIVWGHDHFERRCFRLGPVRSAEVVVRFMTVIIFLHVLEILLWAAFYRWQCFPAWETAFYFSTINYSTVGGTLDAPHIWRNLGPIESITGVLMCGLSASFVFAVVTRLVDREQRLAPGPPGPSDFQQDCASVSLQK
jgi:hypothetical protein